MDKGSGVSAQVLSLPTGRGAMRGMGETIAPELFSGAAVMSLKIELPRGRAGFQPSLTLSYNSRNGNGVFGFGWDVPIPSIARKTSTGVPLYDDAIDISSSPRPAI
jgi:hypothetical protein